MVRIQLLPKRGFEVRNHALRIGIGLVIMAMFLLHGLGWLQLSLVQQLELWSYDYRLLQTMPGGVDDRIIIVDIDEKSLAEVGRWPWSRNRVAGMVDQLFDHYGCLLYTSPSPRDRQKSRMPSSA